MSALLFIIALSFILSKYTSKLAKIIAGVLGALLLTVSILGIVNMKNNIDEINSSISRVDDLFVNYVLDKGEFEEFDKTFSSYYLLTNGVSSTPVSIVDNGERYYVDMAFEPTSDGFTIGFVSGSGGKVLDLSGAGLLESVE